MPKAGNSDSENPSVNESTGSQQQGPCRLMGLNGLCMSGNCGQGDPWQNRQQHPHLREHNTLNSRTPIQNKHVGQQWGSLGRL